MNKKKQRKIEICFDISKFVDSLLENKKIVVFGEEKYYINKNEIKIYE